MQKIGFQYRERQQDCANAYRPATASTCDVTPAGANRRVSVTIPASSTANPMLIMAMSLPWGGFHDAGPNDGITGHSSGVCHGRD